MVVGVGEEMSHPQRA